MHPDLVDHVLKKNGITPPGNVTEQKKAEEELKEAYLAMAFLSGLSKEKFQDLLEDLSNAFLASQDE